MSFVRTCCLAALLWWGLSAPSQAQQVRVVKLPALQKILTRPSDTTYVVNFWATWCGPCVEELPHFEQLRKRNAQKKVKVLLVSLDFASAVDKKVRPFVQRHKLQAPVWLLNEPDQNAFIDKVDPSWSGALPFTLIINTNRRKRKALEKPLTLAELETALKAFGH